MNCNYKINKQGINITDIDKSCLLQVEQSIIKRVEIKLLTLLSLILIFGLGFSTINDADKQTVNRIDQDPPPPPEVLKDLSLPGDLWDLYRAANIRLERNEVRHARAPAQSIQRLHRRWNEDKVMETALHAHGNWDEIRSTEIGAVRYIEPRSGMLRRLMVKLEESDSPGFQRWVYYQYEDLSALGMGDHFIPRVAVDAAIDGSEAYFVRLDPDRQTSIGHFGKTGWSIVDGRKILWIHNIPDTDHSTAIFSYEENGDTAIVKFYNMNKDFMGELIYNKTDGAGSFMAPGQNENNPICWDSSMVNSDC